MPEVAFCKYVAQRYRQRHGRLEEVVTTPSRSRQRRRGSLCQQPECLGVADLTHPGKLDKTVSIHGWTRRRLDDSLVVIF